MFVFVCVRAVCSASCLFLYVCARSLYYLINAFYKVSSQLPSLLLAHRCMQHLELHVLSTGLASASCLSQMVTLYSFPLCKCNVSAIDILGGNANCCTSP